MEASTSATAPRPLLPFQRRAVDELVEADGLCVLAAGLGWAGIVGAVLRLQVSFVREEGERGAWGSHACVCTRQRRTCWAG